VNLRIQRNAVQGSGFQLRPPAAGAAAPAVAQVEAVLFGVDRPLQHIVQKWDTRLHLSEPDAPLLQDWLDAVPNIIDCLKFHLRVVKNHFIQ